MGPSSQHGRLELWVAAGVLGQVVAAHETLVADGAAELLLARVGAVVAGQFVRAGKALATVGPRTREWTLAGVRSQVGFQVGALAVHLLTAFVVALVDLLVVTTSCRCRLLMLVLRDATACRLTVLCCDVVAPSFVSPSRRRRCRRRFDESLLQLVFAHGILLDPSQISQNAGDHEQ